MDNLQQGKRRGVKHDREYRIWKAMKTRCYNPNYKSYPDYGGRGVTVCRRWRHDYGAFLEDMGRCPPGYSIHRVDNDGPYSPDNCEWAGRTTQNRERRITRIIEWQGSSLPLGEACERAGVDYGRARQQLARGLTFDQAIRRLRDLDNARSGILPEKRMCMRCFNDRPLADFHKATLGQFGVKPYCRECLAKPRKRHPIASLAREHGVSAARLRRRMGVKGMSLASALADIAAFDSRGCPKADKVCSLCGAKKPIAEFHVNSKGIGGRRSMCKPCQNARAREHHRRRRLSQLEREA